jgi:rare lipoprotein A (peptidoglycan hydrolase)
MRTRTVALALLLATLAVAAPARAHDLGPLLRDHRDLPQVERLQELHGRLHDLLERYGRLERRAGRGWIRVVDAERAVADAERTVGEAEAALGERVRTAYQLGPGAAVEALLGAGSFADLASISEFTARTIALEDSALRDSIVAHALVDARRARALASRERLEPMLDRLRAMLREMESAVDEAKELARTAALEQEAQEALKALEAQQAAVVEAAARMGTWDLIGYQDDQNPLLALLGPTGGRTCETPAGLAPTGEVFEGYASWYGWEFGGQPTATGAIFDPRLFTAANRWLPFGTFLRVTYGGRCAVVLVNDRGPYGRLERVIDLSEAAAKYLGVGVSWVRAEILVPA